MFYVVETLFPRTCFHKLKYVDILKIDVVAISSNRRVYRTNAFEENMTHAYLKCVYQ